MSLAVAFKGTTSPSINTAPLVGLVNATVGGRLLTVMFTSADVFEAPRLSVATALNTCVPFGALVHVRLNGLFVFSPNFKLSANNSSRAIEVGRKDEQPIE